MPKQFRNVGIIAHIDAGKTTVTERILFYTKKERRLGSVDEGTAAMDWLPEEQARGITIASAATSVEWGGFQIQIIDTPGHVDFTSEVERCLRVLDGAVGVFCGVSGVQAQSETVWRQADRYAVPRIAFVNKLDRNGADFERSLESMRQRLGAVPVPVQIPLGLGADFSGVIDLLELRVLRFDSASLGAKITFGEIPEDHLLEAWDARDRLIEAASEFDEELLECFVEGRDVSSDLLRTAIRKGALARRCLPVFCGAALRNVGVQPLLDGIGHYLPSPSDLGTVEGMHPTSGRPVERELSAESPCAALAFKTVASPAQDLIYLRVYSGVLKIGDTLTNGRTLESVRVDTLFELHADSHDPISRAEAGAIAAVAGLPRTTTGDSLYDESSPILFEPPFFPDSVLSMAIEPESGDDRAALLDALAMVSREDPTFRWREDPSSGELVISGMGELHLEVVSNRLRDVNGLVVHMGRPRVAYRQTVSSAATAASEFDRELGEVSHWARVEVEVEPHPESIRGRVEYDLGGAELSADVLAAIESSVSAALLSGGARGMPVTQICVRILSCQTRDDADSSIAVAAATEGALGEALRKAGVIILEPWMRFEMHLPDEAYGAVSTDLGQRRATIREMDVVSGLRVLRGEVPLAEVFGYTGIFRALSQGRGSLSLEPFAFVPTSLDGQPR